MKKRKKSNPWENPQSPWKRDENMTLQTDVSHSRKKEIKEEEIKKYKEENKERIREVYKKKEKSRRLFE